MSRPHAAAPWRPTGFVGGSAVLHAAALAGVAVVPDFWPWAIGAIAANQAAILAGGLLPRSRLLGPNWTRLPRSAAARGEVALSLDDGPDPEVTPRVLEVLERHGVRATFFCIGERATRHPGLVRAIAAAGHAVENHSFRHRHDFALLGPRRFLQEIGAAQDTLAALAGVAPRFFRAPAGLRNPFLDYALARLGLQLVSWTRRGYDTRNANAEDVLARLTRALAPGDILLLHDGHTKRSVHGAPVVLEVLPRLLDTLAGAGLRPVTLRAARD
ncbi:MAG: polysaccharide deacetylase family protein [Betaproteobacteria bacterium]|nr:polysaccharide deacetylase family protein [Betaproteobacteria bacterium]